MQPTKSPTFSRYNRAVWALAFRNGKSRGIGLLIGFLLNAALLAIQVALGLYSTQTVASRWFSFIGVQVGGLLILAVGYVWHAAWSHHASAHGNLEALGKTLPMLTKVQLIQGQVADVQNELVQFAKTGGTPARPLGYNSIPFPQDRERWDHATIKLAVFQSRYKLVYNLVSAASLIVKDPVPPYDTRLLYGFPNEAEYAEVCDNIASYMAALRAYAMKLEAAVLRSEI